jgi:hypothetical protein
LTGERSRQPDLVIVAAKAFALLNLGGAHQPCLGIDDQAARRRFVVDQDQCSRHGSLIAVGKVFGDLAGNQPGLGDEILGEPIDEKPLNRAGDDDGEDDDRH